MGRDVSIAIVGGRTITTFDSPVIVENRNMQLALLPVPCRLLETLIYSTRRAAAAWFSHPFPSQPHKIHTRLRRRRRRRNSGERWKAGQGRGRRGLPATRRRC